MPPAKRACQRCHSKKIKCNAIRPICGPCAEVDEPCIPHVRLRRNLPPRESTVTQARVSFLEEALSQFIGWDAQQLETGSDISSLFHNSESGQTLALNQGQDQGQVLEHATTRALGVQLSPSSDEIAIDILPDISLLTLNASGEMRYLGPSSGSLFAKYASHFAGISSAKDSVDDGVLNLPPAGSSRMKPPKPSKFPTGADSSQIDSILTPSVSKYLLNRFFVWVHSLLPLFGDSYREQVLDKLCNSQVRLLFMAGSYDQRINLTIWNLVIALGALHVPHGSHDDAEDAEVLEYQKANATGTVSSDALFMRSLAILDTTMPLLQPSVSMIQILLLICIYGSYKPSGNRQWQLAGIAIRTAVEIGLHRHRSRWNFSNQELEVRRRVFWTAYVVEMTAAFNLGRPPSISNDHIDAKFPQETAEAAFALHNIRHRQIQSQILDKIYCCPENYTMLAPAAKTDIISSMQEQLDQWKRALYEIYSRSPSPFPIQYWERLYFATTAAIHRPTPLSPIPSPSSASLCLRSAGAYIDAHHYVLKDNKVPQSWMLLQGMFLAGITMIVTARTNRNLFRQGGHSDCSVFKVMEWNRKCSNVLNIMSERWADKSISDLEAKFTALSTSTMKLLLTPIIDENPDLQNRKIAEGDDVIQTSFEPLNNPEPPFYYVGDNIGNSQGDIGASDPWLGEMFSPNFLDSVSIYEDMYGLWEVSI